MDSRAAPSRSLEKPSLLPYTLSFSESHYVSPVQKYLQIEPEKKSSIYENRWLEKKKKLLNSKIMVTVSCKWKMFISLCTVENFRS